MLQRLLEYDQQLSSQLYNLTTPATRRSLHLFGITGEGYLWLVLPLPLAMWYQSKNASWHEALWANLWLVNVIDLIFIATLKFLIKRPRPVYEGSNKTAKFLGPDCYSLPSGHASLSWTLAGVYSSTVQASPLISWLAMIWAVGITMSRVLMGRHYLSDALAGFFVAGWTLYVFKHHVGMVSGVAELYLFNDGSLSSEF